MYKLYKQSIIIFLIVLLIIIVAGGFLYFMMRQKTERVVNLQSQQTFIPEDKRADTQALLSGRQILPSSGETWQKYENEKYGFTVEHPEAWHMSESCAARPNAKQDCEGSEYSFFINDEAQCVGGCLAEGGSVTIVPSLRQEELDNLIIQRYEDKSTERANKTAIDSGVIFTYRRSLPDYDHHFFIKAQWIDSIAYIFAPLLGTPPHQYNADKFIRFVASFQPSSHTLKVSNTDQNKYLTYENARYGFRLSFPLRWNGFIYNEDIRQPGYITFLLPRKQPFRSDEMSHQEIFSVKVTPRTQWTDKTNNPEPASGGIYVASNDQYVFEFATGHDDGGIAGFPEPSGSSWWEGPYFDIKNIIIPSFSFINSQNAKREQAALERETPWVETSKLQSLLEKTQWKTYTNYDVGFSFRYPGAFVLTEEPSVDAISVFKLSFEIPSEVKPCACVITITVADNRGLELSAWMRENDFITLEEFKREQKEYGPLAGTFERKVIVLNGISSIEYDRGAEGGGVHTVFIPVKDKVISITGNSELYVFNNFKQEELRRVGAPYYILRSVYDEILKSFTLTGASSQGNVLQAITYSGASR